MKFFVVLAFVLTASLVQASYIHEYENINSVSVNQSLMSKFFLRILHIFEQFKESKQRGQQRQKAINYGCIWKICGRPLMKTKQSTTVPNRIDVDYTGIKIRFWTKSFFKKYFINSIIFNAFCLNFNALMHFVFKRNIVNQKSKKFIKS